MPSPPSKTSSDPDPNSMQAVNDCTKFSKTMQTSNGVGNALAREFGEGCTNSAKAEMCDANTNAAPNQKCGISRNKISHYDMEKKAKMIDEK